MITNEELEEISERCRKARPQPWRSFVDGKDFEGGSDIIMVGEGEERGADIEPWGATVADQDFMAHARQDVPRLLAEVRRLRELLNLEKEMNCSQE